MVDQKIGATVVQVNSVSDIGVNVVDPVVGNLQPAAVRLKGVGGPHILGYQPGVVHFIVAEKRGGGPPVPNAKTAAVKKGVVLDVVSRPAGLDVGPVGGDGANIRNDHVGGGLPRASHEKAVPRAVLNGAVGPGVAASPRESVMVPLGRVTVDLGVMLDVFLVHPVHPAARAVGEKDPAREGEKIPRLDIGMRVVVQHPLANPRLHQMGTGIPPARHPEVDFQGGRVLVPLPRRIQQGQ